MTRWAGSLVALVFCGGLLAGCGSDSDSSNSPTPTAKATPSASPSTVPTPAPTIGPQVSYFGLARADGTVLEPSDSTAQGVPIFVRNSGSGFMLIVEGRPGASGAPVALSTYNEEGGAYPDLQILASRSLGDGSTAVCDIGVPAGGVPGVTPPSFDSSPSNINSVNDLACRFRDGEGHPLGVGPADACTLFPSGEYEFVNASSTVQYCAVVARVFAFADGDTLLTVRLRDIQGFVGPPVQLLVRVVPPPTPLPTATATPMGTPGADLGPEITYIGVTRADGTRLVPADSTEKGDPIYLRRAGFGFSLVVEGKPGRSGAAVSPSAYQEDLVTFPDLQIEVSRELGNGSAAVCDIVNPQPGQTPTPGGGVPATDPTDFALNQTNIDTVNDLACRFRDGQGQPIARTASEACVLFPSGEYGFVNSTTTAQFCAFVDNVISFPVGDTVVTARLRDVNGNVGPARVMVIRVL